MTLSGRTKVIRKAEVLLIQVKNDVSPRPIMLYGLRGVGKTVLLNHFLEIAKQEHYIAYLHEMSEKDDFKTIITRIFKNVLLEIDKVEKAKELLTRALRVFKSITFSVPEAGDLSIDLELMRGKGDSGNFEWDLVDLVESVGYAAREYRKCVCILIDETQYINEKSLSALIAACHRISQKGLPVVFLCAGLPQILMLTGDAKSYSERLFEFIRINGLSREETEEAIVGPALPHGVAYEPDALEELAHLTGGYPYFIQEFCRFVWDVAPSKTISRQDVLAAKKDALAALDDSFFKIRLDRATESEKNLMRAMAELGKGTYKWDDILTKMNKLPRALSPVRTSLIKKGFVYVPTHGSLDFSVPKFDEFLQRHFGL